MPKPPLIAIVDDDAAVREAFGDLLHVAGLLSQTYAGALDFLDDYAPGRFDLVITDVRMPKMDGFQLLQRLRTIGAAPPAIVVTSSAGTATWARAIELGALACLTKPVADDALLRTIGLMLGLDGESSTPG